MSRWRLLGAACLAALALTACEAEEGLVDAGPEDAFTQLYNSIGSQCAGCHAPGAPGNTAGVEQTQDWSSVESARTSLRGTASGLMGNFEGCNGVPFIGDTVETSLIVAVLDEDVRADFTVASNPDCTGDAIADMGLTIGRQLSAQELSLLKQFVMEEIAGTAAVAGESSLASGASADEGAEPAACDRCTSSAQCIDGVCDRFTRCCVYF